MNIRTQFLLSRMEFRRGEHGCAEAALHIAAEDGLRGPALKKAQKAQGLSLSPSAGALAGVGSAQSPEGVGPDETDAAALAADITPGKGRPLAVGDAAAGPVVKFE